MRLAPLFRPSLPGLVAGLILAAPAPRLAAQAKEPQQAPPPAARPAPEQQEVETLRAHERRGGADRGGGDGETPGEGRPAPRGLRGPRGRQAPADRPVPGVLTAERRDDAGRRPRAGRHRGRGGEGRAAAGPLRRAGDRRRAHGLREPGAHAEGPRQVHQPGPGARGSGGARDHERSPRALAGVHDRPRRAAPDALAAVGPGAPRRLDGHPLPERVPGGADRGGRPDGTRRRRPGDPDVRHRAGPDRGGGDRTHQGARHHGRGHLQLAARARVARGPVPRAFGGLGPQGDLPPLGRLPDRTHDQPLLGRLRRATHCGRRHARGGRDLLARHARLDREPAHRERVEPHASDRRDRRATSMRCGTAARRRRATR